MKKNVLFIVIFFISISASYCQSCFVSKIDEGKECFNKQRYKEAIKCFESAKTCSDKTNYRSWETICDNWIKRCSDKLKQSSATSEGKYYISYWETYPKKGAPITKRSDYASEVMVGNIMLSKNKNYRYKLYGEGGLKEGSVHHVKNVYQIKKNNAIDETTKRPKIPTVSDVPMVVIHYACGVDGIDTKTRKVEADITWYYTYSENDVVMEKSNTYYGSVESVKEAAHQVYESRKRDSVKCAVQWYQYPDTIAVGTEDNKKENTRYNNGRRDIFNATSLLRVASLEEDPKLFSIVKEVIDSIDGNMFGKEKKDLLQAYDTKLVAVLDTALNSDDYDVINKGVLIAEQAGEDYIRKYVGPLSKKLGRLEEKHCSNGMDSIKRIDVKKGDVEDNLKRLKVYDSVYSACPECTDEINNKRTEIPEKIKKEVESVIKDKSPSVEKLNQAIALCNAAEKYNLTLKDYNFNSKKKLLDSKLKRLQGSPKGEKMKQTDKDAANGQPIQNNTDIDPKNPW